MCFFFFEEFLSLSTFFFVSFLLQLTICGFKSFGEELTIDSFNDESNVLIGNKGGGKSSVLEAISFALNINEDYENFTQDDFQTLIHKSDGSPVTSAFVEIVIEWNGDNQVSAVSLSITQSFVW